MIRFVHIGDQIVEDENAFAFFDTVTDTFLDFGGCQVFESRDDFETWAKPSDPALVEMCLALLPDEPDDDFGVLLQSVRFMDGTVVLRGEIHEIEDPGHVPLRLYTTDLYFVLVAWTRGSEGFTGEDVWSDSALRVQVLMTGYCAYREDGVRHLYVGEQGYLNYPTTVGLSRALTLIHELYEVAKLSS